MPTSRVDPQRRGAVILVPGLGLGGLEITWLARSLRRRGWPVSIFRHFPWRGTLKEKAAALAACRRSTAGKTVHLVGHSMGGNIVLACLASEDPGRPGRVVLLGTPVNGSVTADRVSSLPLGSVLLGPCMNESRQTRFRLPADREVGGIAGRLNAGVGLLVGVKPPADGVVRIDEVLHDDMRDAHVVDSAHTSMLFSLRVAAMVDAFLRNGRFGSS